MSIETSPAPSAVKTPSSSEAGNAKGKSGAASGASKGGVHTGFSAILESLEGDAATTPTNAVAAADDTTALTAGKTDATDVSGLDPASLLAQSLQIPVQPAEDGLANAFAHLHAQAGKSGAKPSDAPVQGATDKADANPLLKMGIVQQDTRAKSALAAAAQSAQATQTAQSTASDQDAAARQTKFDAALEVAKTQQPAQETVAALVALPAAGEKQAHERQDAKTDSNGGGVSASSPVGSTAAGTSVGGVSDSAAAPDVRAAEQVTYWVSHDVQKAEMKLDGVGEKPVEVSISMQGNEAQVAFRTDEVQTRAVLESASSHLKDMLQREGVMLTGVSVGTSGAGDSGGQERQPRQGARQALVEVAQTTAPVARAGGSAGAGRAVDLFV